MINVLELCAGAGGLALGFAKAGFQHLGLVDHDQNCVQTLKANFTDVPIINEDLNLFLQKISTNKDQLIKSVDILVAGLPCQSFSYVGKGQGLQDARGLLFFTFIEIMQVLKPKLFLIENVKGLQSNNHGRTLKLIIQQFHLRGYEVKYQVRMHEIIMLPKKEKGYLWLVVSKNMSSNIFNSLKSYLPNPS